MKVQIGDNLNFTIAQEFANWVHASVVSMHLRASYGIHPADQGSSYTDAPFIGERIQEMRKFVRSIRDPYERQCFCRTVKHLFIGLRRRHNTCSKFQDYVASVRTNVAAMKEAA